MEGLGIDVLLTAILVMGVYCRGIAGKELPDGDDIPVARCDPDIWR